MLLLELQTECPRCYSRAEVSKKKEIALKEKASLEDERDRLHQTLIQKEKEYEQFKGHKFLNREEFKQSRPQCRGVLWMLGARGTVYWDFCQNNGNTCKHFVTAPEF